MNKNLYSDGMQEPTPLKVGDKVLYTSPATKSDGTHYQYETTITKVRTMKSTGRTYYTVAAGITSITAGMLVRMTK